MMNFYLTEEQKQLVSTIHKFAAEEVRPVGKELDAKTEPSECFPWTLVEKAIEMQIGAALIPENFGGCGYKHFDLALMLEELAWGDAGFATTISATIHPTIALNKFGTEEQKDKWFKAITQDRTNRFLLGAAFTEPSGGSDVFSPDPRAGIQTTAVLDGNEYVLNGTKCFITNAGLAQMYLIWARTDKSKGAMDGGLSVFIVPADAPGIKVGKIEDKMGQRLSQQAELIFEDCRIPKENLLGQEGMGFPIGNEIVVSSFSMVGAMSLGLSKSAFEYAYEHSKQRVQGGMPIIHHQAIGHKLADIAMSMEALRSLLCRCTWTMDNIMPDILLASMCKVIGSDLANKAAADALQIFGGYGYSKEYPLEKLVRDAKVMQIYDAANETHKNTIMTVMQFIENMAKQQ
jgi:acyl-CoA dehydrogenase